MLLNEEAMAGVRRSAHLPQKKRNVPNITVGVLLKYVTVYMLTVLYNRVVEQYLMKQIEYQ